jgi:flagellar biosynthesis protein
MSGRDPSATPIAVALRYDGTGAPRVTAKGHDEVAERIVALAREHGVALHEEAALAAVLARIPLGDEIPEALYRAVAEVIAFAYLLSGRWPPGVPRPLRPPADRTPTPDSGPGASVPAGKMPKN